jgi:hypothetical protein
VALNIGGPLRSIVPCLPSSHTIRPYLPDLPEHLINPLNSNHNTRLRQGFPRSLLATRSHLTASPTMIPDHNNSPVDSKKGQHRCGRCGSDSHPSNWCWNRDYTTYHPGRSLDSTLHAFRVSDLPSGPPVDELKRPTCATCGGNSHYGVFGCPNGNPRPSYLPGPKTEWFPPAGKPARR